MMRLYLREVLAETDAKVGQLSVAYEKAAKKHFDLPMPGYTHTQKAMPTTVSAWLDAYADGFTDARRLLQSTLEIIDQNPLGSAAGFGSGLPIDKDLTTKILGFSKTQVNPLYCGISRGMFELLAVQALQPLMLLAGKFVADMMLFTTEEFSYFSLPAKFTTGSSIMPHKANYDLFEIVRAKSNCFGTFTQTLYAISAGVGSGYHRDLQLTKKTTIDAFETSLATLEVLLLAVPEIKANEKKLVKAITEDMKSVAKIDLLVTTGIPFRDAYHKVKKDLK